MKRPSVKFTLPESKAVISVSEWISGKDAEYIEAPILKAAKLTGRSSSGVMDIGIDAETSLHEQSHRKIESYITEIKKGEAEGDVITSREEILKFITEEIPNSDYVFALEKIDEVAEKAKKK